ncbi:23S rRNA (adenine(2030)-N(6))-methyltransferase RlmJ [Sulfuriferula nivalis]|uniref:Ribosomal RNA large subunit methyltransferase J n=1 Tax=Sulfuriferula nivalis TaxID=2675298 RepID=A0A809SIF0_9PROT|nr:23S rRNA (adenine(2030)-N(6))-methyltransferase RlmJ [Sulfuriferula nivalis]BBP01770.1 ribosomal RNA large subunit methyltransferase J [Sulfuriferula nivalis]
MLSYRHAFHAGNHADVLKHFVQLQILQYFNQKDKPYWAIDTHAGAGLYALDSGYATQNAEFQSGIAKLIERNDIPAALAEYVTLVRGLNPDGTLKIYPGSPWVAMQVLRSQDQLKLFELHPTDSQLLHENFASAGRRVKIQAIDGFTGLKAVLPPAPRRGFVLIDPPYEEKQDYQRVPAALKDALKRFETGTYAVWYPQLQRHESQHFVEALKRVPAKSWLNVSLAVQTPSVDGFGMHGSGMFIINPPWTLHATLKTVMLYLTNVLGQDKGAGFVLETMG